MRKISRIESTMSIERDGIEFPVEVSGQPEQGYAATQYEPGMDDFIDDIEAAVLDDVWAPEILGRIRERLNGWGFKFIRPLFSKGEAIELSEKEEEEAVQAMIEKNSDDSPDFDSSYDPNLDPDYDPRDFGF